MIAAQHLSQSVVASILRGVPRQGKRMLSLPENLTGIPLGILEDSVVVNAPEIHRREGDLWQCLEGEAIFVVGGELVDIEERTRADGSRNPDELTGAGIEGGTTYTLHRGDWLWIPSGVPHQHSASGTARLIIIKIRA